MLTKNAFTKMCSRAYRGFQIFTWYCSGRAILELISMQAIAPVYHAILTMDFSLIQAINNANLATPVARLAQAQPQHPVCLAIQALTS